MLKRFWIFILSIFLLTGCSNSIKKEEISFMSWGSITEVKILNEIIENFEQENPELKINFIHVPQNYYQKLHLLFASNTAPDVVFINNLYLPVYEAFLEDLSAHINQEEFYLQAIEGLSYDNKLLAVPRDISNLVLYVNTDYVGEIKFSTIEDLLKSLKNISKTGKFGISFEENIYWALPYLSYFGEVFDEKYDPKKSKGLEFYLNLREKYHFAPLKSEIGSSTLAQMFLNEQVLIYLSGRWMFPKIKEKAKFNWAVAPFPTGKNPQPCDSSGWALSKSSKHKEASLKFIQYLSSEKSSKYFANTGLVVPARKEASKILNNKEHNEFIFLDVIKDSKSTTVTKNYSRLVSEFNMRNF